jgi:hypothetical protein
MKDEILHGDEVYMVLDISFLVQVKFSNRRVQSRIRPRTIQYLLLLLPLLLLM